MTYTKTNWKTGDTISAEKLNKMEDGIEAGSNVLSVEMTITPGTPGTPDLHSLNKTYGEIYNAFIQGIPVIINSVVTNDNGNVTPLFLTYGSVILKVVVEPFTEGQWIASVMFYDEESELRTIAYAYTSLDAAMNAYPIEVTVNAA